MSGQNFPGYIQYLMDPSGYSHPVDEVQLLQTHISYVILAGEYVYKWKKPVRLGFLDFSTLKKRKYYCEQELSLNRRLCPEVYLDVISINQQGDSFLLNSEGEIVEYGVKMVRLPESRMMGRMIKAGQLGENDFERIVTKLVGFYQKAKGNEAVQKFGTVHAIADNIIENLIQIETFIDNDILGKEQFEEIRKSSLGFLQHGNIFEQRLKEGRIRDCHGDLHSGNICMTEDVCIFDCIEFSDRLRCGDIAADVAFLAMDLELHGLETLSRYFIERFIECSGDTGLMTMLAFYKCYRACVRGKINLLTSIAPALDTKEVADYKSRARSCFSLAQSYLRVS